MDESVVVDCGCGATLSRVFCPPTVGNQPRVSESESALIDVRGGMGRFGTGCKSKGSNGGSDGGVSGVV